MVAVDFVKFETSSPGDVAGPLQGLQAAGYAPEDVVAIVGKTEGNGCTNDFSRTLSTVVWEQVLAADAVSIFSGGTEGVLTPHVNFLVKSKQDKGLQAAVGHTRAFKPEEVGAGEQVAEVAATVKQLMAGIDATEDEVKLVLVKCPLLTSTKIESIRAAGKKPLTTDTYESMAKSRYATAVGIAVALGELHESGVAEALETEQAWSSKASCSSGAELEDCHVLVLASPKGAAKSSGSLHAVSGYMKDAIDAQSFLALQKQMEQDNGELVQVFAKAGADPAGTIRGKRHTMSGDSDIHSTRHARAAVGGLLAGLTADTMLYVSGGFEGQGPVSGGSLTVVYRIR